MQRGSKVIDRQTDRQTLLRTLPIKIRGWELHVQLHMYVVMVYVHIGIINIYPRLIA